MIDLKHMTITKARADMEKGEYSAEELTHAYLENIKIKNKELNAFLTIFEDAADEARKVDDKRKSGEKLGVLAGIPIAIKDAFCVKGRETRAASKILQGHIATYDATAVAKLREADAVLLGMTNMDEFAMGSSSENSAYGPVRNPLDPTRVPGGSSGGSAAAVAGQMAVASIGSDTGCSVRLPASFCGVIGFKPTYGAISRYGLIAMASSLDHVGPMTNSVLDAEIMFDVMKGPDGKDATAIPVSKAQALKPVAKMVIGLPTDLPTEGVDPRVLENLKESAKRLATLGYQIEEIKLPNVRYAIPTYYIIVPAEVSANLARFDGVRYGLHVDGENLLADYALTRGRGFGKEVRRRILLGTYVLSAGYYDAYYYQATRVRELITRDFNQVFSKVDAIIMPTTPGPAFEIGTKSIRSPLEMYAEDLFTAPTNLSGHPAISVPSGMVREDNVDLPLGLQIIAPKQRENIVFAIGKKFLGENKT
ncbi:MAG TPA: Asp-tRNA(Asn)/Glu-tRNA(Gln) amidotransferase subunit GatA [Candidatus Paceibacterota bacterium]